MADTVDNRPVPPGPGERRPGPGGPQGLAGATDLASRNDRDTPSGPANPGRRWLSPPAAGARPGQRGRPRLVRPGRRAPAGAGAGAPRSRPGLARPHRPVRPPAPAPGPGRTPGRPHGASRANGQAAAEVLGLISRLTGRRGPLAAAGWRPQPPVAARSSPGRPSGQDGRLTRPILVAHSGAGHRGRSPGGQAAVLGLLGQSPALLQGQAPRLGRQPPDRVTAHEVEAADVDDRSAGTGLVRHATILVAAHE